MMARWSCGFNNTIVTLTLNWFIVFELVTQPSQNIVVELKIANSINSYVTTLKYKH